MGTVWTRLTALSYGSVAIATLATLAAERSWLLELFSHFRVQYVAIILVLLALMASLNRWLWAGLLLPLLVLNTLPLLPYLSAQPAAAAATDSINLASINLLSRNKEAQPLLSLLSAEHPDVIVLQEFTPLWADQIAPLHARYPHRLLVPREGNFGIALLSVYPFVKAETFDLLESEYPTIKAVLKVGSSELVVIGVHPVPPTSEKRARLRNAQLTVLAALADKAERPLVVLGDFNTSPWSPHFQRLLADGKLRNGSEGFGLDITWPTSMPLLGIPIDHCLVSRELRVTAQRRGSRIGSDHYPLFTEVALAP